MVYDEKELAIVRELAKKYMEIAMSEKHVNMRRRFRDSNDLKIVRPPVIIEEIPWHEMNFEGALDCQCQNKELRQMEYFFARNCIGKHISTVTTISNRFGRSTNLSVIREMDLPSRKNA